MEYGRFTNDPEPAETAEENQEKDGEFKRETWGSWLDFLLASIGYAVGLGNLWRFPYLCYENGGGAFLVPYIIMLAICGLPLFYMEFAFGQFSSRGAISVWEISPLFRGIGMGMILLTCLTSVYYNVIIAWTVYYTIQSFSFPDLPWVKCDNDWNTDYCFDDLRNTTREHGRTNNSVRASVEFWSYKAHSLSGSFGDFGGMNWPMVGCLFASWVIVCACISKGVKSSGKVVYFTATFPYIVLVIFFIRGVTLPGAWQGIRFYIVPVPSKLLTVKPWSDAATQIFYSLGLSFGGLITFASYNPWKNNCQRDALIVSLTNCGTSVFAGFVIFSILGYMAHSSGQRVEDIVQSGIGLAFIAYPEALSRMAPSQLWSVLFFVMLFTLGLDSQFASMETIVTATVDELPPRLKKYKLYITIGFCCIGFLLGLPMVTKSGLYLLKLMNEYSGGLSLLIIAIMYSTVICHIYGTKIFCNDIKSMIGIWPNIYWRICWKFVSPIVLIIIVILSCYFHSPTSYGDYVFPVQAQLFGWAMSAGSCLVIPAYMIYIVFRTSGESSLIERVKSLSKPTRAWGPLLPEDRKTAGYNPVSSSAMNKAPNADTGSVSMQAIARALGEPFGGEHTISNNFSPSNQDHASTDTPNQTENTQGGFVDISFHLM